MAQIVSLSLAAYAATQRAQAAMHERLSPDTVRAHWVAQQRFLRLCAREVGRG